MSVARTRVASIVLIAVALGCGGAGGCASSGVVPPDHERLFYPPLPNTPRLQFLFGINSDTDLYRPGFLETFLAGEALPTYFQRPQAVAWWDKKLYVCQPAVGRITTIDFGNNTFEPFKGNRGAGAVGACYDMFVTPDGSKFVADGGREPKILEYDANDEFVRTYGSPSQFRPVAVAVTESRVYAADMKDHEIEVFDRTTGSLLFTFGQDTPREDPFTLAFPVSVKVDQNGDVYVLNSIRFQVAKFTADGEPISNLGQAGDTIGAFARPKAIAVGPDGLIYVLDAAFANIQVFDQEYRALVAFPAQGDPLTHLSLPSDVEVITTDLEFFKSFVDPNIELQYVIMTQSQFGDVKVKFFGFGDWVGPVPELPESWKREPRDSGTDGATSSDSATSASPGAEGAASESVEDAPQDSGSVPDAGVPAGDEDDDDELPEPATDP